MADSHTVDSHTAGTHVADTQAVDSHAGNSRAAHFQSPHPSQPESTQHVTEQEAPLPIDHDIHTTMPPCSSIGALRHGFRLRLFHRGILQHFPPIIPITDYEYENGRRYHAYKAGEYVLPNDEAEQDRLDLQHHIYRLCLGGALHCAPIESPQRVLDSGTGTGIWAIEFADEYPSAIVIGTDLSPIQPGFVPPNVKFYVDDFEQPWEFDESEKFDFIHWRSLCGSTGNWPKLYEQAWDNLKPGAWMEVQEYDAWVYSDDDPEMKRTLWTRDWCETMTDISTKFEKPIDIARFHKQWMEEAGFVDVQEKVCYVPLGPWTRDPKLKELGRFERLHMNDSVEAHSMALYTRVLKYSLDQAKVFFEMVRKEFNDRSLHLYTVYRFIYGRKPDV